MEPTAAAARGLNRLLRTVAERRVLRRQSASCRPATCLERSGRPGTLGLVPEAVEDH